MSKTLFLCGTGHGQQLPSFKEADKFRKALRLLLARGVEAVLEEWDHYGNVALKSTAQIICEGQGMHWEELGLPNDSPTFSDTMFDPPLPAELDTVRLIPPPETIMEFVAGRTLEAKAWEKVADQGSTIIVGRYRLDHHFKREDYMFEQIQSQLSKYDVVLAMIGVAHMGSLLRKFRQTDVNLEGFLFTFCEECSVKLQKK